MQTRSSQAVSQLTHPTRTESPEDRAANPGFAAQDLESVLSRVRARSLLIVVDTPGAGELAEAAPASVSRLQGQRRLAGFALLTACGPGERVGGGGRGSQGFTALLARGFDTGEADGNGDRVVDVSELSAYLSGPLSSESLSLSRALTQTGQHSQLIQAAQVRS
jgi:hypothetical protein